MVAEHKMARRIQLRRDTAANWENTDPILAQGEVGVDLTNNKIKVGNGIDAWTELDYLAGDGTVDLAGYATEEYVDQAVGAIIIPDVSEFITAEDLPEPIDLSGYALTTDIPDVSNFITAEDIPVIPADISDLTDTEGLLGQGGGDADTGDITFDATTISAPDGADITIEAKDENSVANTSIKLDPEYASVRLNAKSQDSRQFFEGESQDYDTGTWTTANGSATLNLTSATRFLDFINDDSEWRQAGDRETGEFSLDGETWYQWPYSSSSSGLGQISVTFNDESFTTGDPIGVETFYLRWINESYVLVDQDDYSEVKIVGAGVGVNIKSTDSINTEAGDSINFEAQRSINLQTIDEDVRIRTNIYGSQKSWEFKTDGTLKMPDTGELAFYSGGTETGKIIPSTSTGGGLQVEAQVDFEIRVTQGEGEEETAIWSFEPNGELQFPDGTTQTTAYTGEGNGSGADTGNITFNGATISTDETEQTIIIEALDDDGEWNTQITLNPEDIVAKMSAREEDIESFNSGNWGTATWTNEGGDNKIVFTDAPDLRKFLQSSIWDNGGDAGTRQININFTDRFDYDGFNFEGDDVTLFLTFGPAEPAESVDNIEFFWINESRIAVDQNDFEEIQIFGRGIGMVVNVTQDIDIRSGDDIDIRAEDDMSIRAIDRLVLDGDRVRIRSRSSDDTVEITTDYEDDEYTWQFRADGSLSLPRGGIIREDVVTENPTIELVPDNPQVTSQKLVIKGGQAEEIHLHLTTGNLQETSILLGTDQHNVRTNVDGGVEITSYNYIDEVANTWLFDFLGRLEFPDGTLQTTAWAGGRVVEVPSTSVGAEGDKAGDIAFSSEHLYYCFEDYDSGVSYNTTLSNITEDDNKFIFAKDEGVIEPEIGWSITVDVGGENEETHTITNVEDLATDWRVTWSGGNVTFDPGTAIRIFSTNIWKRVAWSNDTW
jgi:hypothetical protein